MYRPAHREALRSVAVLAGCDHVAQEGAKIAGTCVFGGWGAFRGLGENRLGEHTSRVNVWVFLTWSWAECVIIYSCFGSSEPPSFRFTSLAFSFLAPTDPE